MSLVRFWEMARWLAVISLAAVTLTGCPSDDECEVNGDCVLGQVCQSGRCVATILTECTTDTECGAGKYCGDDGLCVTGCKVNSNCPTGNVCIGGQCAPGAECFTIAECGPTEQCVNNVCVDPGIPCRQVGQACDPTQPAGKEFVCRDFGQGNRCYAACERRDVCVATRLITEQVCPAGSLCVDEQACKPSDCTDPRRGQIQCDELAASAPAGFPNGANCVQTIRTNQLDQTNFQFTCQAAGPKQEGEACLNGSGGIGGNTNACARGLTCVDRLPLFGTISNVNPDQNLAFCAKPCTLDVQCGDGQRCIGEDSEDFGGVGVGVCADWCQPHTVDNTACSDGRTCLAISATDGICTGILPVGKADPYDSCSSDDVCPSGTLCISGQCLPQCDPTLLTQDERNDTCFGGNPNAYLRLVHLAQDAGSVDVYLDNVKILDNVAFGDLADDKGDWFVVKPGAHTLHVVDDEAEDNLRPLTELLVELGPNTSTTFAALPKDSAVEPVQLVGYAGERAPLEPQANQGTIRAAHAVVGVGGVDVVATTTGADVSQIVNQMELAVSLPFGGVAEYQRVANGTYDVYIFPQGAVRLPENAAATFLNTQVDAGATTTIYAFGQTQGANQRPAQLQRVPHKTFRFIPRMGGYCLNLAAQNGIRATPAWGFCFERCPEGPSGYGNGVCDGDNLACSPFGGGESVCFGAGPKQLGEVCDLADEDCADGLYCDRTGDNKGICRSYCLTDEATAPNPALAGCQGTEVCVGVGIKGLGRCQVPCTPGQGDDFTDNACAPNQRNCYPSSNNADSFYCTASGVTAIGETCFTNNSGNDASLPANPCAEGALCVRNVPANIRDSGFEQFFEAFVALNDGENATCRQLCRPFRADGQSDCPSDFACMPILPTQNFTTKAGVCMPKIGQQLAEEQCAFEDLGKMCADGAVCTQSGAEDIDRDTLLCSTENSCLRFCDPVAKVGCLPTQRCTDQSGGDGSRQLFLGAFGICRDIR